ncbi:MAG: hypothetical protein GF333_02840 [Candidatus Omnitrophica bacterium]|nr:hypothetical protein [Candidatus Omnitrophota bacterium]
MYRPSKLTSKTIGLIVLLAFFLLVPFKEAIQDIFVFFSKQIVVSPQGYRRKLREKEKENLLLSLKVRELAYLKEENQKLRQALEFKRHKDIQLVEAEIVYFDPSTWRRLVTINAGKDKKIKEGAFVIDAQGWIIGKIVHVKETHSNLMLVDDPDFTLPVFVGENSFGLLQGSLEGAQVRYIEKEEAVEPRQKIWIQIPEFNAPLYIGEVSYAHKDPNSLFWDIRIHIYSANPFLHTIFVIQ